MTDETNHPPLEEILNKIFGPIGRTTPDQTYWPPPNTQGDAMKETLFTTMLRAYGLEPMCLPDDVTVTRAPGSRGIYVETFCFNEDGKALVDDLTGDAITRNVFHPEP